MRICLVSTVHEASGPVTLTALVSLLERLEPDVIFAEVPKSHLLRYAQGSHGTLESRAVAAYSRRQQLSVVPVDLDEPDEEFFRTTKELFDLLERSSRDYRDLIDRHTASVKSSGLRYLNSSECMQAWLDVHHEVRASIDWLRMPHLHAVYDRWCEMIDSRDRAMLDNIADYTVEHSFKCGVFLVGAAHRRSIVDKVRSGSVQASAEWHLDLPADLLQ